MKPFNLLQEMAARVDSDKLARSFMAYMADCTAVQRERASSLYGRKQNAGMLFEATKNPNTRQNAQKPGEQSHGDVGVEYYGNVLACELKALSPKTKASDAENGTTAPLTLLFFYDRKGYFARLGRSCDVKTTTGKDGKRKISYQDNLDFGEAVDIHKIKTFALDD